MAKKRKVRCPNKECGQVNEIDVDAELEKQEGVVVMYREAHKKAGKLPEYIVVPCRFCDQEIKIKVAGD